MYQKRKTLQIVKVSRRKDIKASLARAALKERKIIGPYNTIITLN